MCNHIYNKFRLIHFTSKCFNMDFIKFKNEKEITTNTQLSVKIFGIVFAAILSYVFFDTFYYMITKPKISKIDLVYILEIPVMYCAFWKIHYFVIVKRNEVTAIVEKLDQINKAIIKYYTTPNIDKHVDFVLNCFGAFSAFLAFSCLFVLWLHFYMPFLKMYTLQYLVGNLAVILIAFYLSVEIVFLHRINMWNNLLEIHTCKSVIANNCDFCTKKKNRKLHLLCTKHLIR